MSPGGFFLYPSWALRPLPLGGRKGSLEVSAKQKLNLVMFLFLLIYLVVSWHVGRRETHLYAPHAPKEAGAEGKGEMKDWCIAIAVEIVAASLHISLLLTMVLAVAVRMAVEI